MSSEELFKYILGVKQTQDIQDWKFSAWRLEANEWEEGTFCSEEIKDLIIGNEGEALVHKEMGHRILRKTLNCNSEEEARSEVERLKCKLIDNNPFVQKVLGWAVNEKVGWF